MQSRNGKIKLYNFILNTFLIILCISCNNLNHTETQPIIRRTPYKHFVLLRQDTGYEGISYSYWIDFSGECYIKRIQRLHRGKYKETVYKVQLSKGQIGNLESLLNSNNILFIKDQYNILTVSKLYLSTVAGRIGAATISDLPDEIETSLLTFQKLTTQKLIIYKGSFRPNWSPKGFPSIKSINELAGEE